VVGGNRIYSEGSFTPDFGSLRCGMCWSNQTRCRPNGT